MRRISGFVLVSLALAAGCASQETSANRVKVYPVEGKLDVLGRPAGGAHVAFHHANKDRIGGLCPVGVTRPDGTFQLITYSANDGAPEGEYTVTVIWPNEAVSVDECCADPLNLDRLHGRYFDSAKSTLRATVRAEHNDITLYATVGGTGWNLPRLKDTNEKKGRPSDRPR